MNLLAEFGSMRFKSVYALLIIAFIPGFCKAQNQNFIAGISLGIGESGFKITEEGQDDLRRIYYPIGGIHLQKRISSRWAINFFPNVGMSGNDRVLASPQNNITKISTRSAFVNLAVHPKLYFARKGYVSLGPEVSYLIWNYGSAYNGDVQISRLKETKYFNRTNLLISSSIGYSTKVEESRKNAPIQIFALWFIELRLKKGITNILSKEYFGNDISSNIFSVELVTGISFASKN